VNISRSIAALTVCWVLGSVQSLAQNAYITNTGSQTVSVVDTQTNSIRATIPIIKALGVAVSPIGGKVYVTEATTPGNVVVVNTTTNVIEATIQVSTPPGETWGVAVTPDGNKVYVTDPFGTVSVIDAVKNVVITTITAPFNVNGVNTQPFGVAVSPDGTKVYVTNIQNGLQGISVIDTRTDTVTATIRTFEQPEGVTVSPDSSRVYASTAQGTLIVIDAGTNSIIADTIITPNPFFAFTLPDVAVSPDGGKIYVANDNLAVIDAATVKVITMIPVGTSPEGVALTPDGRMVYVANQDSNNVSVIDPKTNKVIATIPVGSSPEAFIIRPVFAGTQHFSNCFGQSTAALSQKYGTLNAAAAALGFPSATALQNAIRAYCG
jgi:YVTN family beta-propeller protein